MHPTLTLNSIKHQIKLLCHALIFLPDIRKWFDISDNPLLAQALKRFLLISGAIYWPYINFTWTMKRRLATIDQHYRMLGGHEAIIAHATFEEVDLARLDEYDGLRLVLDKTAWFLREGEIVLNLFVNEQRVYSIVFTLGLDGNQPVVFVGALQGSNFMSARGIYRDITHALHGMRPRDLLMTALKLLCGEFGIHKIWAISGDFRQHNSPYFGGGHKEKVMVSYNKVWVEHEGKALDNGFFEIPAIIRRKSMSNVPTRKRATYRRRYRMLDKLALDIKSSVAHHAAQQPKMNATD
ncbi:MAG: VirK/YbjX family protein [Gallionella sp.]|nr:VirK/YbjX family protein [Gallionella sp.]